MYRITSRLNAFKTAFRFSSYCTVNDFKTDMKYYRQIMKSFRSDVIVKVCTNVTGSRDPLLTDKLYALIKKENANADDIIYTTYTNDEILSLVKLADQMQHKVKRKSLPHLERELVKRIHTLSKDELLVVADAFFAAGYECHAYFLATEELFYLQWDKLNILLPDILQLLFFKSVTRNSNKGLFNLIEQFLSKNTVGFTLDQISLICHTYFVCNTSIKDMVLLDIIADNLLIGIDSCVFPGKLINIMKALRHSGYDNHVFYGKLEEKLCQNRYWCNQLHFIAQICKCYSSVRFVSKQLLDIVYKLVDNGMKIEHAREKDLLYIITGFATSNYKPPKKLIRVAVCKWRKRDLITKHPEAFVDILSTLAIVNEYPQDLVMVALSDKFTNFLKRNHHQLELLDTGIGIEAPECTERLSENFMSCKPFTVHQDLWKSVTLRDGLTALVYILQELLKDPRKVDVKFLLKYSHIPDIEIRTDEHGVAQVLRESSVEIPISKSDISVSKINSTSILSELMSEQSCQDTKPRHYSLITLTKKDMVKILEPEANQRCKKIAIRCYTFKQYFINELQLTGQHKMEIRHLNKLGYTVVEISPYLGRLFHTLTIPQREHFVLEKICNPLGMKT